MVTSRNECWYIVKYKSPHCIHKLFSYSVPLAKYNQFFMPYATSYCSFASLCRAKQINSTLKVINKLLLI